MYINDIITDFYVKLIGKVNIVSIYIHVTIYNTSLSLLEIRPTFRLNLFTLGYWVNVRLFADSALMCAFYIGFVMVMKWNRNIGKALE